MRCNVRLVFVFPWGLDAFQEDLDVFNDIKLIWRSKGSIMYHFGFHCMVHSAALLILAPVVAAAQATDLQSATSSFPDAASKFVCVSWTRDRLRRLTRACY
ncbi:hypothetical protein AC1031_007061 [Aphanomyces cochlioides]|nr:hypothetical protein AC1031_007061 [Aphanomyces cochlioides]